MADTSSIVNTARTTTQDPSILTDAASSPTNAVTSAPASATTTQTTAPAAASTVTTAPAASPTPNVADWYRSNLGRDPDAGGAEYWQSKIDAGADPQEVYKQFQAAAQANGEIYHGADYGTANTYSGPKSENIATPVDDWGRNVLGRELTPAEMAEWQQRFAAAGAGGVQPAQSVYDQFLQAYGGQVKKPLDMMSASQINTGLQPVQQTPQMTASTYDPTLLGDPKKWNVTPEQTTAGQLTQIMDPNSPIIQQAMSQGLQLANERGLLNSSIAQGAAQDSAYKVAVPIANSDAAVNAKASGYNADESNQFSVHNADYSNAASQFNANAQNTLNGQLLSADTQKSIAQLQSSTQTNLAYLDNQTKTNLATLDSSTRTNLATIEANYHNLMQSNQSASDLFRQITQNITTISMSKDLDGPAKQQAVDNQLQMLKNGLGVNGAVSNLNLASLLDFSNVNTASTSPAANTGTYTAPDGSVWASKEAYDVAHAGG